MNGWRQALEAQIGITHRTDWLTVDQSMIDRFADSTLDHQYIHVDPVRAAVSPFGATIAHGFLTLSLITKLREMLHHAPVPGIKMTVNYGVDRLRFVHPVRSGSRIRAAFTLVEMTEKRPGQFQQAHDVAVEIDGVDKPALTTTWLTQFFV